jgi:hypothetical protein
MKILRRKVPSKNQIHLQLNFLGFLFAAHHHTFVKSKPTDLYFLFSTMVAAAPAPLPFIAPIQGRQRSHRYSNL